MIENEKILINHLCLGDEWAYEILFKEYAHRLTLYANSILNDEDLAKEVVQDLFVNLFQNRKKLHIRQSIKNYLYISTRNNALKILSKTKHEKAGLDNLEVSSMDSFLAEIELVELREKLFKAIENLPEKTREYFKLSRYNQLSYAEIADEKGVSVKTVEYHMSKAIRILMSVVSVVAILFYFLSKFF